MRATHPGGRLLNLPSGTSIPSSSVVVRSSVHMVVKCCDPWHALEASEMAGATLIYSYYMLVPSKQWQGNTDFRALCSIILEYTLKEADKYQIGLTKIFFRAGMLALLESLRTNRIAALVTMVQKNIRRALEYRRYQKLRKATIKAQALYRGKLARREYESKRREAAAVRIQTVARGWLARSEYKRVRDAVIRIQSGMSTITAFWEEPGVWMWTSGLSGRIR